MLHLNAKNVLIKFIRHNTLASNFLKGIGGDITIPYFLVLENLKMILTKSKDNLFFLLNYQFLIFKMCNRVKLKIRKTSF
jgi:hypothetical protein